MKASRRTQVSSGSTYGYPVLLGALFVVATCIKVLLLPSYRSTDFEVHRNWLAITHSLPVSRWYYEDTSPWTLDYPPFFAWFEWVLSQPAALLDANIVNITSLNYASHACILYQRFTVICCDLILVYALMQYYWYQVSLSHDKHGLLASRRAIALSVLVIFNYGLLVVDHIHFQYNGFLLGMLLLSTIRIMQGRYMEGGLWFSVLLNFKHIFMYMAPAFFLFLLKYHCFKDKSSSRLKGFLPINFIKLGSVVITVFCLSFGPFIYLGQIQQVLSRLFPFKRGLCHAYWAPNMWALYSVADMLGAAAGRRLLPGGVAVGSCDAESCGSMASGLVGEMSFKLLPDIPPWLTFVLTVVSMLPGLVRVWLKKSRAPCDFPELLVLCAYSSFLFGWHVHEKAVLLIIIPMSVVAVERSCYGGVFLLLSVAGHVSLFPLLYQPAETLVKLSLFVSCTCASFLLFTGYLPRSVSSSTNTSASCSKPQQLDSNPGDAQEEQTRDTCTRPHPLFSRLQLLCLLMLFIVQVYCNGVHQMLAVLQRYQFLPLLLTSVSCALVVVISWAQFIWITIS